MHVHRRRVVFVAQSEIQGELAGHFVIVLDEEGGNVLAVAEINLRINEGSQGNSDQQISDAATAVAGQRILSVLPGELHVATRSVDLKEVFLGPAELPANSNGMAATHQVQRVPDLALLAAVAGRGKGSRPQ